MPDRLTIPEFQAAIRAGRFQPGDAVLYRWGRRSPLAWAIARVQRRALVDLLDGARMAEVEEAAEYTHAGMVVDAEVSAEMTSPRARMIAWPRRLRAGDTLRIVRPVVHDVDAAGGYFPARWRRVEASVQFLELLGDADDIRYPYRELLTYWFSALPGAIKARHFADHFASQKRNVCSGTVWRMWHASGCVQPLGGDALPEAWYPGRMAMDRQYLRVVAEFGVVGEGAGRCPEPRRGSSLPQDPYENDAAAAGASTRPASAAPVSGPSTAEEVEKGRCGMKTAWAGLLSAAGGLMMLGILAGCVAYRAPVIAYIKGPESNYNQERSGTMSRSTGAEQQVADKTQAQTQTSNNTDAAMSTVSDQTKQVGLRQGQAATGTQAAGRESASGTTSSTTQTPTGQQGGDALAVGQTAPTAASGGGGSGTGGTATGATTPSTSTGTDTSSGTSTETKATDATKTTDDGAGVTPASDDVCTTCRKPLGSTSLAGQCVECRRLDALASAIRSDAPAAP